MNPECRLNGIFYPVGNNLHGCRYNFQEDIRLACQRKKVASEERSRHLHLCRIQQVMEAYVECSTYLVLLNAPMDRKSRLGICLSVQNCQDFNETRDLELLNCILQVLLHRHQTILINLFLQEPPE